MNIDNIIETRERLDRELRIALATMERKDNILKIRQAIINNQKRCPHVSDKYNWTIAYNTCPYCGFEFSSGGHIE